MVLLAISFPNDKKVGAKGFAICLARIFTGSTPGLQVFMSDGSKMPEAVV